MWWGRWEGCARSEKQLTFPGTHLNARSTVMPSKSCEVGFIIPILWTYTVTRRPSK